MPSNNAMSSSNETFGIISALAAPFIMTLGFIIWANHWVGSPFALNMFKCNLASILFVIVICTGISRDLDDLFPKSIFTLENVGFLMLSSTIGIIIGDLMWLDALRLIGAKRVIVVDTIKPFLAALFGYVFLKETLHPITWLGMSLTVIGVLWVSLEKENRKEKQQEQSNNVVDDNGEQQSEIQRNDRSTDEENQRDAVSRLSNSRIRNSDMVGTDNTNSETLTSSLSTTATTTTTTTTEAAETQASSSWNDRRQSSSSYYKDMRRGYVMSVLNVVFDTFGSLLTKKYGIGMTTWEINLIRFGFAGVVLLLISLPLQLRDYYYSNQIRITCISDNNNHNVNSNNIDPSLSETNSAEQIEENTKEDNLTCPSETADKNDIPESQSTNPDNNDEEVDTESIIQSSQLIDPNDNDNTNDNDKNKWYALPQSMPRRSWVQVSVGVLFVTFLTPALSNYALFQITLALALTLGSVGPIYSIPLTWVFPPHDKPTIQSWLGTSLAVGGIAILSFAR